jgi:hypothetical protein
VTHGSAGPPSHRRGRFAATLLGVVACASVLVACDSDDGASSTPSSSVPRTTATTAAPTEQRLEGNLQVTGDRSVNLPRATGRCRMPTGGLAKSFTVTSPALGPGGSIIVFGPTTIPGRGTVPPNVKAFIGGAGLLSPISGTGVTVRPDLQTVVLDTGLGGSTGGSRNGATITGRFMRAHISGTLRCV